MNILVTGAFGFLGRHLCPFLEAKGHRVFSFSSKECDLKDPKSLHRFNHIRFDFIYHLAAWTQAGDFCLKHPAEQWLINQKINTHVLDWWAAFQPKAKMVAMGTSCSYDPTLALIEENYLSGEPIESLYTYAMTKRMLLVGLQALHKQFGLKFAYFVPSTLYGPGYHTDGRQLHFIFDLIRKILLGKTKGDPVVLWGDGHQKRELIHVDDFIRAMYMLSFPEDGTIYNIGSGVGHSIREFAQIICDQVGYPFENIAFDTTRYVGAKSKVLSIAKLEKKLPDFSMMPLQEGIGQTVKWFQECFEMVC